MIGRGVCIYVLACKGEEEGKWYKFLDTKEREEVTEGISRHKILYILQLTRRVVVKLQ